MNRNQLSLLLILVIILGGIGWLVTVNQRKAQSAGNSGIGKKLFKDFQVNDVTSMTIRQGTNEVSLVRKDDLWRVRERNDYPANFPDISGFLVQLRELKAVQMEQVGPSQLPRLQLAPPGQGSNSAVIVELKGQGDKPISTLLLGKMHLNSRGAPPMGEGEGGWPDGRYVKVGADSSEVAVISTPFENIEPKPGQWLSKDFIRVERPRSVEVTFPIATNSWKLIRENETADWKLADIKPGEELDSAKVAAVSNPFSSPSFNDVIAGTMIEERGTNQPVMIAVETFDNFQYVVKVGQQTNDIHPMTVSVTARIEKDRVAGKDEKPEDKARLEKEFKEKQQKLEEKLKREQSCDKWTYLVSSWAVEPALKERSALMAEKKDDAVKTGEPKVEDPPLPAIHSNH